MVIKKIIFVALLVFLVFISACSHSLGQEAQIEEESTVDVDVSIRNFKFGPRNLVIEPGTTVTWTNQDSAIHTATGINFDSGPLTMGQSYSYMFNEVGRFSYKCTFHPYMRGSIIVE